MRSPTHSARARRVGRRQSLPRTGVALALAAFLVTGAVACGDDSSSSSATTAQSTATTGGGGAATTGNSGAATTGAASGGTSAADVAAYVAAHEQQPTKIENTTPIGKPVPTGLTVDTYTIGASVDPLFNQYFQQGTDALGWKLNIIQTDGSPAQVQNAWEQMVRDKPAGIAYKGTPREQIATYMDQANANGTALVVAGKKEEGILYNTPGEETNRLIGEAEAYWITDDANQAGTGKASVVYLNVPDLPILGVILDGLKQTLPTICDGCSVDQLDIGFANLANANDQTISYLRSHPDTKYVVMASDGIFIGLAQALKTAGLDVTVLGDAPTPANIADIQSGVQAMSIANDFAQQSLGMIDVIARHAAGVDVRDVTPFPSWILTKDNIDQFQNQSVVADPLSQFKTLWGV